MPALGNPKALALASAHAVWVAGFSGCGSCFWDSWHDCDAAWVAFRGFIVVPGYISSLQAATQYTSRPVDAVSDGGALRTLRDVLAALLPQLCPPEPSGSRSSTAEGSGRAASAGQVIGTVPTHRSFPGSQPLLCHTCTRLHVSACILSSAGSTKQSPLLSSPYLIR